MIKYVLLFLLFIFKITLSNGYDILVEDHLLVLNESNFQEVLENTPYLFVMFHSKSGWLSKKHLPEFSMTAEAWKRKSPRIVFGKVLSENNEDLVRSLSIEAYPTLVLYINKNPNFYKGLRYEEYISAWIHRKLNESVARLKTIQEIEDFNLSKLATVIYFGNDEKDIQLINQIAEEDFDNLYAIASSQECFEYFNASPGTLAVFRNEDGVRNDLNEEFEKTKVLKFIHVNTVSPFMYFNEVSTRAVFSREIPAVFLFRSSNTLDAYDLDDIMKEVADEVKGKYFAISTDIKDKLETQLSELLGVWDESLPTVKFYDPVKDKFYNLEGEITKEGILKLIQDWEQDKLKYNLKSEEIPKKQDNSFYKIVSKSFEDVVINSDKDVLVLFWFPFAREYDELVDIVIGLIEKYKKSDLLIAELNISRNKIEVFKMENMGIVLWCAGKKDKPIIYEGELKFEEVEKFILKHIDRIDNDIKESGDL